jgi:hypothetical protein
MPFDHQRMVYGGFKVLVEALSMLRLIGAAAIVLVGGLLAYIASRPDSFQVQRTATIKAPPEKIFAQINRLPAVDRLVAVREEGPGDAAQR